ncbi:MAG TPA: DegV family protein [Anaerolineaceae bacterium]|nr:DegV family protein [Anaerolineaceae bacterium]
MKNVAILTDSVACVPEDLLQSLKIRRVAYYIHRGQEVLRDLVTIHTEEFVRWLQTAETLPTTAAPGPGEYYEAFEQLAAEGVREVVSIHITSRSSGAYQAAMVAYEMARERLPELRIEVIDTLNVSMCQGWMVIEAARAALAGCSVEEITAKVRAMIPVTRMLQTADTLRYLAMGGRIGKAQHLLGSLLDIKPIIGMADGVIVPLGAERSRRRVYQKMAELVAGAVGAGGKIKVAYVHAGARQQLEQLREQVEKRVECVETLFTELSPALAVHSGPGTTGLCYYPVR